MGTDETRIGQPVLAHGETTSRVSGAAFEVHNTLGYGFLEKVYRRAMQVELIKRGSKAEIPIRFSISRRSWEITMLIFSSTAASSSKSRWPSATILKTRHSC